MRMGEQERDNAKAKRVRERQDEKRDWKHETKNERQNVRKNTRAECYKSVHNKFDCLSLASLSSLV